MLFMVRFILLVFHFLYFDFPLVSRDRIIWSKGMTADPKVTYVLLGRTLYLWEQYVYWSSLLRGEVLSLPHRKGYSPGTQGESWLYYREKRVFGKPGWRHLSPGSCRVAAQGELEWEWLLCRNVLMVALAPSVSTWLGVILLSNAFRHQHIHFVGQGHSHCPGSWGTFCWGWLVLWIDKGCCRAARTPKELLWALTSAGALEFPSAIQYGSETLNLGCLFVSDYKCVSCFSLLNIEI